MIFKFLLLLTVVAKCLAEVPFKIKNLDKGEIWVGIQGNPGHPHLEGGGFALKAGQEFTVNAPDNWQGRFWPRTFCNPSDNHCGTGDCGNKLKCNGAGGNPPATLVEITLKGDAGKDYYDISLVDGFNLMASIEPVGGQGDGSQYSCKKAACPKRLNDGCPEELKIKNGNNVIACTSACNKFNTDQYCCRGEFNTLEKCKSSTWPHNYPDYFKKGCPDAYSYAFDDHKSLFSCKAGSYSITFGG